MYLFIAYLSQCKCNHQEGKIIVIIYDLFTLFSSEL